MYSINTFIQYKNKILKNTLFVIIDRKIEYIFLRFFKFLIECFLLEKL